MFTLYEINEMECKLCGYLEWRLNVKPDDLRDFEIMVRQEYGIMSAVPATFPVLIAQVPAVSEPRKPSTDYDMNPYPSPVSTSPSLSCSNLASQASFSSQTALSAVLTKGTAKDVTLVERSQVFAYTAPSMW